MDATLNSPNDGQSASFGTSNSSEKSELMRYFESQVNDTYWAYRDLLTEIFSGDSNEAEA